MMTGMFKETKPKDECFLTFFKKMQERYNLKVSWIFVHCSVADALGSKEGFIWKKGMDSFIIFQKIDSYEEVVMIPLAGYKWYSLVSIKFNHTFFDWENSDIKDPEATILIKSE